MFLLLTDKHGKKAIVNMEEVGEISYDIGYKMTTVLYKRTLREQYAATLQVQETPEEIWEMMGAMK